MISPELIKAMKNLKREFVQLQNDPIISLGFTIELIDANISLENFFNWTI